MDENAALETLFYPFEKGFLDWPDMGQSGAFLCARFHSALLRFEAEALTLQQNFKPYCAALEAHGFEVFQDFSDRSHVGPYDFALIALPKNRIEAEYFTALALESLREGGRLVLAAHNKAGGGRILKMLKGFGLEDVRCESKNKARVAWGVCSGLDRIAIEKALAAGKMQAILDGAFYSQAGIYGWNKKDYGSGLLCENLPETMAGRGADFGCGYGYLSAHILGRYDEIKALVCLDADWRAVKHCEKNLARFEAEKDLSFIWADLTEGSLLGRVGSLDFPVSSLDFIVMNPPFHEGKGQNIEIGQIFISHAARTLRKGGQLYMVANTHLAYETVLEHAFSRVEMVCVRGGFKVFWAVK